MKRLPSPNRPSTVAMKHGPIWVVCSCRRLWRINSSKTSPTEQPKTLSRLSTHCPRLTASMPISIKRMPSASSDSSTKKPHRQPSRRSKPEPTRQNRNGPKPSEKMRRRNMTWAMWTKTPSCTLPTPSVLPHKDFLPQSLSCGNQQQESQGQAHGRQREK